jgi:hypothetical protein
MKMSGSTTPMTEQPDWHPVHRANALLREALQGATKSFESLEARYSVESLSDAIDSVMNGPVQITYPRPLAVRLDDLDIEERMVPGLERYMHLDHEAGERLADFDEGDFEGYDFDDVADDVAAPVERDETLSVAPELWDEDSGEHLHQPEPLKADIARDAEPSTVRPQLHVHTLMGEFRRRQRHASLLVAASIGTAILLTIGGVVLAASFASANPAGGDDLSRTTTVVWQAPGTNSAKVQLAVMPANRAGKDEATRGLAGALPAPPKTVLAAPGRQVDFGALLPPIHARYFLVRGLPPKSSLSGGRQSGAGAWLIKGEHVSGVTLTLGEVAAGDYRVEVYILQSGDGPQARRNLVLRVAPSGSAHAAASSPSATLAATATPDARNTAPHAAVLRARSAQLLGEGDIAAARLLLLHLAERGDGEAAYDLARTFDGQMLAELGAEGLDGDPARARGWYERASQVGNIKAAERLKILASLSGTGPSD